MHARFQGGRSILRDIWKPRAPLKLALPYDVCRESFRSMRIAKSYGGRLICKILQAYPYLHDLPRVKTYHALGGKKIIPLEDARV